jgi:hypothetical protein
VDGQGLFKHDIPTNWKILSRSAANVICSSEGNGVHIANAKSGSFVRALTMLYPWGAGAISSGTTQKIRVEGATSDQLKVQDCIWAAGYQLDDGLSAPNTINSIQGVSQATAITYFADPLALGTTSLSLRQAIAAATPIHTDLTAPVSGTPIGAVSPRIDFRNRTYDAALMAA